MSAMSGLGTFLAVSASPLTDGGLDMTPDAISASTSPELTIPNPFVMNNPFAPPPLPYNDVSPMSSTSSYPPFLHTPEVPVSIIPTPRDLSPFNEQTEPYIQYYFEHVRKLQFVLAGNDLTQTLSFVSASFEQITLP
jgi:hypothetical protein